MKSDMLNFLSAARDSGQNKARNFFDFAVNGRSLRQVVDVGDRVGVFGWLDPASEASFARQLLLREPSELSSGRVPIYVCGDCGDLGCACISVRVTALDNGYTWSEFSVENSVTPDAELPLDLGEFVFPREAYRGLLRRFLWPRGDGF